MKLLDLQQLNIALTKQLNRIAEDNRTQYTEFVDACSQKHEKDLFWWVTPFACRHTYSSSSFQNVCKLLLAKEIIDKDKDLQEIVVENRAMKKALKKYISKTDRKIRLFVRKKSNTDARLFYAFYIFLDVWYKEYRKYKVIRKLSKNQIYQFDEPIYLIDTPVLSSHLKGKEYTEAYFPDILEYTKENIYLCPTICFDNEMSLNELVFGLLHCTNYKFILKEMFWTKRDLLQCLRYPIKNILYCRSKKVYRDLDVTSIVNCDLIKGLYCSNSIIGILNYYFIKNLLKTDISIKKLIGWYEGQPSSTGLFIGYQKYSGKEAVGYAGCPMPENLINLYPSHLQGKSGISPKIIGIIGSYYSQMVTQYNRNQKFIILPALRHAGLYRDDSKIWKPEKEILIVLSYFMNSSKKLIRMINQVVTKEMGYKIIFKNHPTRGHYTLQDYEETAGDYAYEFVTGDLISIIKGKSLVIAAETTAGLEILAQGVPLILCEDINKLTTYPMINDFLREVCKTVYCAEELKTQMLKILKSIIGI